jgi:hypothetical protein
MLHAMQWHIMLLQKGIHGVNATRATPQHGSQPPRQGGPLSQGGSVDAVCRRLGHTQITHRSMAGKAQLGQVTWSSLSSNQRRTIVLCSVLAHAERQCVSHPRCHWHSARVVEVRQQSQQQRACKSSSRKHQLQTNTITDGHIMLAAPFPNLNRHILVQHSADPTMKTEQNQGRQTGQPACRACLTLVPGSTENS